MAKKSLSGLCKFVRGLEGQLVWIGVDVHKGTYHATLIAPEGRYRDWSCSSDNHQFVKQLQEFGIPTALVAYEAGPTGFSLARELDKAGIKAVVVAPTKVMRTVGPSAKTDRLDSVKLAQLAMSDMLKLIAIPSLEQDACRCRDRRRHRIVDRIRQTKQRIKSTLLYFSCPQPPGLTSWSNRSIELLNQLPLHPQAAMIIESMVEELQYLLEAKRKVEGQLKEITQSEKHRSAIRMLTTVPGVGQVVATTFRLELFRIERFEQAKHLAKYLGLAPTNRRTGKGSDRPRLMPCGQKRLRSLLVEAAWIWIGKEPWAKTKYLQLKTRTADAKKAIVALARKPAIILWRISIEERPYRAAL